MLGAKALRGMTGSSAQRKPIAWSQKSGVHLEDCIRAEDKKRSLVLHGRRLFLRAIFIKRNLVRLNVGLCRGTIRFASLSIVCHHRLLSK
jgi:hypothetical protein